MSQSALHLTARDFDAYAPEKATSNAFSRPRMEVKQRALAWARGVVGRLGALGITVEVHGSDEHPSLRNKKRVDCQWVFFWRDPAAREELDRLLDRRRPIAEVIDDPSPYTRHAFLALKIEAHAVQVCFAIHPEAEVDIENLRARLLPSSPGSPAPQPVPDSCAPHSLAAELSEALRALPEQFLVGTGPADGVACGAASSETILHTLERAAEGSVPLWIGWSVSRSTAIEHADLLDEQLEDALVALAPVYRLIAWSRENDHLALDRRLLGVEEERARTHAEVVARNQQFFADQAAARTRAIDEARARALEARREVPGLTHNGATAGPRHRPHDAPRATPRPTLDALFGPPKGAALPTAALPPAMPALAAAAPANGDGAATPSRSSAQVMEKGARVRVLSGPFADKQGIVGEMDGRGGARVLLGLLSTRLEATELELVLDGRDRPSLQSSHRRPPPPVPRKAR